MEHELKGTDGVLGLRRSSSGGRRSEARIGAVLRDSPGAADRKGVSGQEDEVDRAGVVAGQDREDELMGTGDGGLKSSGLGRRRSGGRGSNTETS
jgi:hypothetical protein